tara:strand:+ start:6898 stop:7170 length:273 start_codon:yes stop_codon:yes gene_type:complete
MGTEFDNDNTLLMMQLGKGGGTEVFTTAAQSGKDWVCVYFPVTSVIASIAASGVSGETALQTTLPAGTTLFMNINSIQLTSGIGIGYRDI